jgi:hypothetical protein
MAPIDVTPEEWENICDGCGQCCIIPGTGVRCPSLGIFNQCTVYPKRTDTELCTKITERNVERLAAASIVPDDCPLLRVKQGRLPALQRDHARGVPFTSGPEYVKKAYNKQKVWWFKGGGREAYTGDLIAELKEDDT